jgi:hypothetical protein
LPNTVLDHGRGGRGGIKVFFFLKKKRILQPKRNYLCSLVLTYWDLTILLLTAENAFFSSQPMNSWKGEKIRIARLGKEVCFIIQCNLKYFFFSKSQKNGILLRNKKMSKGFVYWSLVESEALGQWFSNRVSRHICVSRVFSGVLTKFFETLV